MLRYFASGLTAVTLCGCIDCEDYRDYTCVTHYSLRYGYYQDCYPVHGWCEDRRRYCYGSNCSGGQSATPCTRDGDCGSTMVCSSGYCASAGSAGGSASGSGGASPADGAAGNGAVGSQGGSASGEPGANGGAGESGSTSGGTSSAAGGGNVASAGNAAGGGGPGGGGTSSAGGAASGAGASTTSSGTPTGRIPRLDFSCVRDTQCGAGECSSGVCYLACESDKECGTGDRCSVETGRRICMPDPNPPVRCDESAICTPVQSCVNGSCHDPCNADADCKNLADRCTDHLCFPDRRPIAECVLNVECAADLVCLNGRCVKFGGD